MIIETNKNSKLGKSTAVALGNFDGLHIGHKYLIEEMKKGAKKKNLTTCVFTFNNDTLVKFKTNKSNNILTSNHQKISLIKDMGVDILYILDFNESLMLMKPYEFIENILIEKLKAKLVVVGFDYRFGHKAQGDVELLKKAGKEYGFEVYVIEPITSDSKVISSSYIRDLISKGQIHEANILLGRPFTICGTVIKGKGRGKALGFATANLELSTDYQIPKLGVYKTYTYVNGKKYLSVTNIGNNPTFGDTGFSLETHIIGFNADIYGKKVEILFENFIRDEIKFIDKKELIVQVMKDINIVLETN